MSAAPTSSTNHTVITVWYSMLIVGLQIESQVDYWRGTAGQQWYHPYLAILSAAAFLALVIFPFAMAVVLWFGPSMNKEDATVKKVEA